MKKWVIITIIISILVLLFILFKVVYFSPVQVKVTDIDGNAISNANVRIEYSCQEAVLDVGGGEHFKQFGYREGISNNEGIVNFNSLNEGLFYNLPFMFNCHKDVTVLKEGYCPNYNINSRTCTGDISENLLTKREISDIPVFFSKSISWNRNNIVLVLKKIDNYQNPSSNLSCKIFIEDCINNPFFNEIIRTKNLSSCDLNYLDYSSDYRFDLYKCFTEIALSEKNTDICKQIYYTSKGETERDKFSPRYHDMGPEYDTLEFQKRCYNTLAVAMKDISLCNNYQNDREFEYCKFEVIKKIGDIEMCTQISIKDIRDYCEVYLS